MESATNQAQRRLEQGTYRAGGDALDFTFWDTQSLLSTALEHRYFIQGVGKPFTVAAVGNKTLADSNILSEGIPNGQRFTIKAFKVLYASHALTNNAGIQAIMALTNNTVLTFKIDGKDKVLELKLSDIMSMNFNVVNVPTVAGDNVADHNYTIIRSAYPLNIHICLAANTRYEMIMQHLVAPAAALDTDKLTICMQGLYERLS